MSDEIESSFQCSGEFSSVLKDSEYIFTFFGKQNIRINDEVPSKLMDRIMLAMGQSIYPLELSVSGSGELLSVINYNNVSRQWNEEADRQIEAYRSPILLRYLDASRKNIHTVESLSFALSRDSLYKFLLLGIFGLQKQIDLKIEHFPKRENALTFVCEKRKQDKLIFLEGYTDGYKCSVEYQLGTLNEINSVKAIIRDVENEGCYKKIDIECVNKLGQRFNSLEI